MELFLLKIVAFTRPIASIEYGAAVFDLAGIGLFGLVMASFLANTALRKTLYFSITDVLIVAFTIWCLSIYVIYLETAHIRDVAKLLIPLLTYLVAKHVIQDRRQYLQLLRWVLLGFTVPVLLSVVMLATGKGVDFVSYWTGLARWRGAYTGAHSMGHSMTLLLMVLGLYVHLSRRERPERPNALLYAGLALLALLALYCLYMSQVRSAILGLLVFVFAYLLMLNRKAFLGVTAATAVAAVVTMPYWVPALVPEAVTYERGLTDLSEIGSGRPQYWEHNLRLYASLPLDRQMAGSGIGNRAESMHAAESEVLDSHNDWLDLLMQTGLVGLVLFALLQVALLKAILRLPKGERHAYLALFAAVNVMMFVSNSYVWRIQVGHLYYLVLAFVEVARREVRAPAGAHTGARFENAASPTKRMERA